MTKSIFGLLFIGAAVGSLIGCAGLELNESKLPTPADVKQKVNLQNLPYVVDDTYNGNPLAWLGQVVEVRKKDGKCDDPLAFSGDNVFVNADPVSDFEIDQGSVVTTPVKRDSILVNRELSAKVDFLNYLSADLSGKAVYSLIVFDQVVGRVADKNQKWRKALVDWEKRNAKLFSDADVCYLYVVRGMVQKQVVRKKFDEDKGGANGNIYGVKVGGTFLTSNEDYSVDIKYGLSTGVLKRPSVAKALDDPNRQPEEAPTREENNILMRAGRITRVQP